MSIKLNRKGAGLAGEDRVKENQNLEMIEQEFNSLDAVKEDSAAAKLSALEALAKADAADSLSKNVQKQLNTIVVEGKNRFDKESVTVDYYVNHQTGELVVNNNKTFTVSDFIPVTPQKTYTRKFPERLAFYDANKVFISGVFSNLTATAPSNAAFVRFDILKTNLNAEQFEEGSVSTEYEPYKFVVGKDSLKNGVITQEKMDAVFLQQLLNAGIGSALTTENEIWEVE